MMQSLTSSSLLHCAWTRLPEHDFQYELRAEGEVCAHYNGLPDRTICQTAEGVWTFQRSGLWKPQTRIRRQGAEEAVATIWWKAFHPTLEIAGGQGFEWHYNFLSTAFVIKDSTGNDLISFVSIQRGTTNQLAYCEATMELVAQASTLPELGLLALAGWYTLLPALQSSPGSSAMPY